MAATAQKSQSNDIAALVATLASRQAQAPTVQARKLTGPGARRVLMLALGEQYGGKIFSLLDDDDCAKSRS
jgi:hypothetical protein